ncbi:hypothetical protein BTUL_0058g00550 [Botrytis tulipae]|uniref:Uncharacterized protein n=1 Tax=Botrytis tulipae TaxID=87230 RepID=A0A4Z1ERV0_9HELO|nr:hypothetical protein BTUL_0058g00550 [Botrytis tulipae]
MQNYYGTIEKTFPTSELPQGPIKDTPDAGSTINLIDSMLVIELNSPASPVHKTTAGIKADQLNLEGIYRDL